MAYAYCGSTSTRKPETFTSHGSDGAEATPMDFGSSDFHPNKNKPWPFPSKLNNTVPLDRLPFNPENEEDAPI
jgi:hypothetical protein